MGPNRGSVPSPARGSLAGVTGTRPRAPVVLFWGEDDFLLREAALTSLGQVRPTEVDAGEWRGGELQDLATPSLFGEARALLVTDCRSLPKEAIPELAAYLASPDPSAPLLLACTVAERGKPPAALMKLIEPVGEIRQVQVTKKDLEPFLVARAKGEGLELTPPAARALVEALGNDVGELASALDQLASAFGGQRVGPKEIAQQFRGLGEQQTWDLCDKAFAKDLPGAMRSLRSLEESGDDALKVLGGIASRLRDLIKVRSLPDRLPPGEVAKRAGLRFDWQARRYVQQASNFTLEDLVAIHERVTEVDRSLKSGGTGDIVMPALVATIAGP
jgi:DNA polymerase III subunit delta